MEDNATTDTSWNIILSGLDLHGCILRKLSKNSPPEASCALNARTIMLFDTSPNT